MFKKCEKSHFARILCIKSCFFRKEVGKGRKFVAFFHSGKKSRLGDCQFINFL